MLILDTDTNKKTAARLLEEILKNVKYFISFYSKNI